jgi:hypothetical protein
MASKPIYRVWGWMLPGTYAVRSIGSGYIRRGIEPWDYYWTYRANFKTPVSEWLNSLEKQPERCPNISDQGFYKPEAKAYEAQLRAKYTGLLPLRFYTSQRGGGARVPVIAPDGTQYPSMRAACDALKVSAGWVSKLIREKPQSGWRYADPNYHARETADNHCCALCHDHNDKTPLVAAPERLGCGAICKRCFRLIEKLSKQSVLDPDQLEKRADDELAAATPNRRSYLLNSNSRGDARWLKVVADYIRTTDLCN